jgi:hypothetical protein
MVPFENYTTAASTVPFCFRVKVRINCVQACMCKSPGETCIGSESVLSAKYRLRSVLLFAAINKRYYKHDDAWKSHTKLLLSASGPGPGPLTRYSESVGAGGDNGLARPGFNHSQAGTGMTGPVRRQGLGPGSRPDTAAGSDHDRAPEYREYSSRRL